MTIQLRGKIYIIYRRVPKRYESVDGRTFVKQSLHTDSLEVAKTKASAVWARLVEGWEAKLAGDSSDGEQAFAAARRLAEARGFRYLDAAAVADLPLEQLAARFGALNSASVRGAPLDRRETAALMGGASAPQINVSRALELYWGLTGDKLLGKSEDQIRRWKNPRKKALNNFIAVVGDKALVDITSDDMLDFRGWWLERMETDGLTPNSANKDLIHLGDVLKTVNRMKKLNLVLPLSDLAFKKGEAKTRPPFSTTWIRDHLLRPGALDGLNDESRGILLAMVNTGARPSELAALGANTIRLDADVPHISIEADGRQLKTPHSRRVIPLLGVSLEAMKAAPEGFPRYRTNSAALSATVNKYLRANGMMETPSHVLYSLRHSFEDRMIAAGVDDRIRRDLFGHALTRERYGAGASLEHLARVIQPFAF